MKPFFEPLDLGGITLSAIIDDDCFVIPAQTIFPGVDARLMAEAHRLDPAGTAADGREVFLRCAAFIVETAGRRLLVDTAIGDGKERPRRPAWHRRATDFLQRLPFAPENVDFVVNTHLHADHVGWNTIADGQGGWKPTFPKARLLIPGDELDFWQLRLKEDLSGEINHGSFADSVAPLIDLGLVDRIGGEEEILPGIETLALPGHTAGQIGIVLRGRKRRAILAADAIHHAAQLIEPDLTTAFCADPAGAVASRRRLLSEVCDGEMLLIPAHSRSIRPWALKKTQNGYDLGS